MSVPILAAPAAAAFLSTEISAGTGGVTLALEVAGVSAAATTALAAVAIVGTIALVGGLAYLAFKD
jgi:threonine dehydrogenase-like Zn-dependent dehydrogenase